MLEDARLHEGPLRDHLIRIQYEDRYKYYWNSSSRGSYKPPEHGTWNRHEFVSLDTKGKMLGYMSYDIDRDCGVAYNLAVISFNEFPHPVFAKDLARFLRDIFEKFHFRKLRWTVCIGNPIEPQYDRLCDKFGGRIVGVWEKEDRLYDGTFADRKMYEIFHDTYMERRAKRGS